MSSCTCTCCPDTSEIGSYISNLGCSCSCTGIGANFMPYNYFTFCNTSNEPDYSKGSINLNLKNDNGEILASTTCIPGKLDTNLLKNGDYIVPTIIKTFELLKSVSYVNSIIEKIKYNLTAFNVAIWLEQSITEYTTNLAQQVFAGTLSVDEFNKSVANYSKSIADKVPDNYSFILNKVDKAINDNLHILTDKPIVTNSSCGCSKPDKEPCGCKH